MNLSSCYQPVGIALQVGPVNFAAKLQQPLKKRTPTASKALELFAKAKTLENDFREKRRTETLSSCQT